MWRKRTAGRWLGYLGIMGGVIAFLTGLIGCVWKESVIKYIWLGILVVGFVFFFVWIGGQAVVSLLHPENTEEVGRKVWEDTRNRLREAAASLEVLSKTFERRGSEEGEEFQEFAVMLPEVVCADCSRCSLCWQERLGERCAAAFEMFREALSGSLPAEAEVRERFEGCINPGRIAGEFVMLPFRELTRQKLWRKNEEGKHAVVTQLQVVSELLRDCSEDFEEELPSFGGMEELISQALLREGVLAEQILIRKRKGRGIRIRLMAHTRFGRQVPVRRVSQCIGIALGRPVVEERDSDRFIFEREREYCFEEEPGYLVLTGVAKATKYREEKTGDSCSFFYPESGETAMLLSDGMGSGEEAGRDSTAVIELMERFLTAGFREGTSMRLINSALLLRSEGKRFSTADLCIINPYAGTCQFVKLGAAASFIKRESWVESVASESLPIGMLSEAEYDTKEKKLYDGDYVIMMSDGVSEALGSNLEQVIFSTGQKKTDRTPQGLAGEILHAALSYSDFQPKDDMTVLVAALVKKQSPFYLRKH